MDASIREATAYHEAGHCVVFTSELEDYPLDSISIVSDSISSGRITDSQRHPKDWIQRAREGDTEVYKYCEGNICGCLAGEIAENAFSKSANRKGASKDLEVADFFLAIRVPDHEKRPIHVRRLRERTERIVSEKWNWIVKLAEALLQSETLSREEVRALLAGMNEPQSRVFEASL